MKSYEKIDKTISKAALQKITRNLWYLTDEVSILSLFDDDVDQETKVKMVQNLKKEEEITHGKRYIPSKEELCGSLYEKNISDFISEEQKQFLLRCVQEHRKIYPDSKKQTLKRKFEQ
ncbi:unnamed protein product [Parnassius mnemosyne]|uniref:Uncharacterized protein n=1 Tax=Parnassius mnemosyne TaxID=213953 RepID=A0AAV1KFT5_9NEOP